MYLKELFETWQLEPLLIATATTGLSCVTDKVIALGTNDTKESKLIFQKVSREELLPAQRYHCISEQQVLQQGLDTPLFVEKVTEALEGKFLMSYNPLFQYKFLSELLEEQDLQIYDLSVIEQAVRKGLSFTEEELVSASSFYKSCTALYFPLSINTICRNLKMAKQPAPGELPLERSLDVLQRLYTSASSREVQILQS